MSMTWKQFKEVVDVELAEMKLTEEVEISWIDVTLPEYGFVVEMNKETRGLEVSN